MTKIIFYSNILLYSIAKIGDYPMLVVGYRGNIDWSKVKAAFKLCTSLPAGEIDKIVKNIRNGSTVNIPNDFVLHEELRELGIKIQ